MSFFCSFVPFLYFPHHMLSSYKRPWLPPLYQDAVLLPKKQPYILLPGITSFALLLRKSKYFRNVISPLNASSSQSSSGVWDLKNGSWFYLYEGTVTSSGHMSVLLLAIQLQVFQSRTGTEFWTKEIWGECAHTPPSSTVYLVQILIHF